MRTLLSFLILPFTFSVILFVTGVAIRMFWDRRKGLYLMVAGGILLIWFSSFPGSWLMFSPLEKMYDPLLDPATTPAPYVVVLGGGYNPDIRLPATSRLSSVAMIRLSEGIRVHRALPEATLILSGGPVSGKSTIADAYLDASLALGHDSTNVILARQPMNTAQEAIAVRELVGDGPVILVTSAAHMPRSVALFRGQGISVIPSPTDHQLRREEPINFSHFSWQPEHLWKSHSAFHEYFGIAWAWLNGQLVGRSD
ncbi:MAG: ElyC/SanA/YdcF family protein [Balneolales bacterium]